MVIDLGFMYQFFIFIFEEKFRGEGRQGHINAFLLAAELEPRHEQQKERLLPTQPTLVDWVYVSLKQNKSDKRKASQFHILQNNDIKEELILQQEALVLAVPASCKQAYTYPSYFSIAIFIICQLIEILQEIRSLIKNQIVNMRIDIVLTKMYRYNRYVSYIYEYVCMYV